MTRFLLRYALKRIALLVPLLVGVTFVTFALVRLGDVNPAVLMAGPRASTEEIERLEEELHVNEPLLVQYGLYMGDLVRGDWGESWVSSRSVTTELRERLPVTVELVALGSLGALVFGAVIGGIAAMRPGRAFDRASRVVTLLGISAPVFWLALLLLLGLAFRFELAPPPLGRLPIRAARPPTITGAYFTDALLSGRLETAWLALRQLMLPVLTITIVQGAVIAKHVRATVLKSVSSDAYRLITSQGASAMEQFRFLVRNCVASVVSFMAIVFTALLGASALVELVFSWGGISQFGLDAIKQADFAVVQAYVLSMALVTAIVFLISDLVAYVVDPRVRAGSVVS